MIEEHADNGMAKTKIILKPDPANDEQSSCNQFWFPFVYLCIYLCHQITNTILEKASWNNNFFKDRCTSEFCIIT